MQNKLKIDIQLANSNARSQTPSFFDHNMEAKTCI